MASMHRDNLPVQLARKVPYRLSYLSGDLIALVVAHMIAIQLVRHFLKVPIDSANPARYELYYIPFFALVLYLFGNYESPELRRPEHELELGCKAVGVSFLGLVLFNFVFLKSQPFSRYLFVFWFALACVLLLALRFCLRALYGFLWRTGAGRRRVLLIGPEDALTRYRQLLETQRYQGHQLVGWIRDSEELSSAPAPSLPTVGTLEEWEQSVEHSHADLLVLASTALPDGNGLLPRILHRCRENGLELEFHSSVLAHREFNWERDEFSGCIRVSAKPAWSLMVQRLLKRAMDFVIGLTGSIITLLFTPLVYLLVNLEDRGPVFHKREYVGTDGKIHYYLKFRTMLKDADEILRHDPELRARFLHQHKLKDDPRLLRVGRIMRRFSVDEFPQFFSLLSGALTFVGPRVICAEECGRYGGLLPKLLSTKPGLTGFWQVMGRQTTTYEERIRMDMFYIDRWSIWLDLVIIAKTFWKVISAEGAY